jgi:hypothetical protein
MPSPMEALVPASVVYKTRTQTNTQSEARKKEKSFANYMSTSNGKLRLWLKLVSYVPEAGHVANSSRSRRSQSMEFAITTWGDVTCGFVPQIPFYCNIHNDENLLAAFLYSCETLEYASRRSKLVPSLWLRALCLDGDFSFFCWPGFS